jgi:hypothetical protein
MPGVHSPLFTHESDCGFPIAIGPFFKHFSLTPAVTAAVEDQDVGLYLIVEQLDIFHPVADVAGVAMKPYQRKARFSMRNKPTMQSHIIGGDEEKVFKL